MAGASQVVAEADTSDDAVTSALEVGLADAYERKDYARIAQLAAELDGRRKALADVPRLDAARRKRKR